ncbi:MAG: ferritin-like domain-containing protein [Alphaproteobacteria bacterium]
MAHWTLDDIGWHKFDRSAVEPEVVKIVKAACMVEHNGGDYGTYLCNVFDDDPGFCVAARRWAAEEVQHGQALRRWAELADPDFDFEAAFRRFTDGFRLPLEARESVRGSRAGELIARCVVEVGTSSYYSALRDAVREPVLRELCHRIAGDEFRHYKLFYTHMRRYQEKEGLPLLERLRVAFGRLAESEDDELAYAYYAANGYTESYDRKRFCRAYGRRALPLYGFGQVERGFRMVLKAVGIKPRGWFGRKLTALAWRVFRFRRRQLLRAAG